MGRTILHTQPPAGLPGAAAETTLPVDPRSASAPGANRRHVRPGREICAEAVVPLRMSIKERALARVALPASRPGLYTPPDTLLNFLDNF